MTKILPQNTAKVEISRKKCCAIFSSSNVFPG